MEERDSKQKGNTKDNGAKRVKYLSGYQIAIQKDSQSNKKGSKDSPDKEQL